MLNNIYTYQISDNYRSEVILFAGKNEPNRYKFLYPKESKVLLKSVFWNAFDEFYQVSKYLDLHFLKISI